MRVLTAHDWKSSMNLLLAVFAACLVIGLVSPRLGDRAQFAIATVGAIATALYFMFPLRFM
jgi:hypothetical protein